MWNEILTFDIITGQEEMRIEVYDKDDFGSDDYEGSKTIKMDKYRDQKQHEEWI